MEPVVLAALAGMGVYFVGAALIPKKWLAQSSEYTRGMLEQLEQETAGHARNAGASAIAIRRDVPDSLFARLFFAMPWAKAAYPLLLRAGVARVLDKFFVALFFLFIVLLFAFKGLGIAGLVFALAGTYAAAWLYLRHCVKRRNNAFLNNFPDALDMIVRSVRSGFPLNAAVRMVSENMQAPVSTEFRQVADEVAFGSTLMDALQRMSARIDEPDIRFFVVVLAVQQEVGGNLAEVLNNLAGIIRKRKHLRLKLRALTSEGRATAWVLGGLPFFVFLMIKIVAPSHLTPLFVTTTGNMVLGIALAIVAIGAMIVRQMINMKI